jgi:hypothetical protein
MFQLSSFQFSSQLGGGAVPILWYDLPDRGLTLLLRHSWPASPVQQPLCCGDLLRRELL